MSLPAAAGRACNALLLLLLLALLFATGGARAAPDASLLRKDQVSRGSLLLASDMPGLYVPAPLVDTDIEIVATGLGARTIVRQRFTNPSDAWVEGIYAFPLPEKAAVDSLRLRIGERFIEGRIRPKAEARRIYETARGEGRKASLVESVRANLFTTSVANIGPGESVGIEIRYQQRLDYEDGRFSLRVPLVAGPRFLPPSDPLADFSGTGWASAAPAEDRPDGLASPLRSEADGPGNPVRLAVRLDAGMPLATVESASHAITDRPGPGHERLIALREQTVPADRDFVLTWRPEPDEAPRAGLFRERIGGREYLHLMLLPPQDAVLAARQPARDVTFIIDTSGSMGGTSIEQARAALLFALDSLTPGERFAIVAFASEARRPWPGLKAATPEAVARAKRWVRGLTAGGGTMMRPALEMAFEVPVDRERLQQIVFITDGNVGNEQGLFALIARELGSRRLFTVGIGSAPNSHFMRGAARAGRGSFVHVGRLDRVEAEMRTLFRRLASPALSEIRVALAQSSGEPVQIAPDPVPDLYAGEPVQVFLRLEGQATAVTVEGRIGGAVWRRNLPLSGGAAGAGLDRLWAREAIEARQRSLLAGADPAAVDAAILALALEHRLVTRLTSLVAVDVTPSRPAGAETHRRSVPLNLPAGWDRDILTGRETGKALPAARDARAPAPPRQASLHLVTRERAAPATAPAAATSGAATLLPQTGTGDTALALSALALLLLGAGWFARLHRRAGA